MSIWSRLREFLSTLKGGRVFEAFAKRPPEKTLAFTIAVIALGAKMAKADGLVTPDEVRAFREVFVFDETEARDVSRFFDLARRETAGYEAYARQVARMFEPGSPALTHLLEGLFYIAQADGETHPNELAFLETVAGIFGVDGASFEGARMRCANCADSDPYTILGAAHTASDAELRRIWIAQARESHPDRLRAEGVPEEAARLAEKRLAAVNAAYDAIRAERARRARSSSA